jgi:hypothetical protein
MGLPSPLYAAVARDKRMSGSPLKVTLNQTKYYQKTGILAMKLKMLAVMVLTDYPAAAIAAIDFWRLYGEVKTAPFQSEFKLRGPGVNAAAQQLAEGGRGEHFPLLLSLRRGDRTPDCSESQFCRRAREFLRDPSDRENRGRSGFGDRSATDNFHHCGLHPLVLSHQRQP